MPTVSSGDKFKRLTAVKIVRTGAKKKPELWLCRCACGKEKTCNKYSLLGGGSKSCGCLRRENTAMLKLSHGLAGTPTYASWCSMKSRCLNPNYPKFKDYGARGIKIYDRWEKFENFLADMGERPKGKTLDRIENDGDYEPANCRWATPRQQGNNQRTNHLINFGGQTKSIAQWCRHYGIGGKGSRGQSIVRCRIRDCLKAGRKITPRVFDLRREYRSDPGWVKGVTFEKGVNKWRAAHVADGKRTYIGKYDTKKEAVQALENWRDANSARV